MEIEKTLLGTVDYIIFAFMLLVSAGIGVYFKFSGGKQKTTEEYLLAGGDMSIVPVAFSLMASFLSAITVIGTPAEMYKFGIHMAYMNIGFVIGIILSSYLSLPVFFDMQASTAYEYLERRFGKLTRTLSSLAFVLQMILYMSVVLYAPALALSAVTNLSTWVSVISIGVVCTFYCTLGGMKAVLWTDVFQAILMFLGIFAVIIKGFFDVGGVAKVFQISYDGGRLVVPGLEFDPEVRYTAWNVVIQGMILSMASFGGNQVQIQRMLTVKNVSRSRKAIILSIPMGVGFHLLNCLAGLVIYAYYAKCDPITAPNHPIHSADQLMPFYMMSSLSEFPGLPGLCICGVFSASLSTVSSAVNSLAAVTMEDLVRPFFISQGYSQKKIAFSAKVITMLYGILCVALTFLVASFGNLVQASLTIFGMLGGPVLSVFLLGMLTTRANEKGVVVGLIASVGIAAWISFGASAVAPPPKTLPISTEGCSSFNFTSEFESLNTTLSTISTLASEVTTTAPSLPSAVPLNGTEFIIQSPYNDISPIYRISYMWFAPIGFVAGIAIGYFASIIFSLITGETSNPPEETLSPFLRYFLKNKSKENEKDDPKKLKISSPVELQGVNGFSKDKIEEKTRF